MAVTLQYLRFGDFKTERHPSTAKAIEHAILMAQCDEGKPLRILSENGAVLVAEKCLEQQIGFKLDPERTQREAIKHIAQEKRDRDAHTLEQQRQRAREIFEQARHARRMQAAEETIPGWGSF